MRYKITRILHSGSSGIRGTDRKDGRYPTRIGRIVDLDISDLEIGSPAFMTYVGTTSFLQTSSVVGIHSVLDSIVCIETINSIFELQKVEDQ